MKPLAIMMVLSMLAPAAFAKTERDATGELKRIFCISMYDNKATERVFGEKDKPADVIKLKVSHLDHSGKWQTNILPVTETKQVTDGEHTSLVLKAVNSTVKAELVVTDNFGDSLLTINGEPQDYLRMGCTTFEFDK